MDIMPFHFLQAVLADTIEKSHGCAVVQKFWGHLRWVLEIHLDRKALARTDVLAIVAEREALFVARRDDVLELIQRESNAVAIYRPQKFIHPYPTRFAERQSEPFRLMPENKAEELARSDCFLFCHTNPVFKSGRLLSLSATLQ